jgi:hypothetical protein
MGVRRVVTGHDASGKSVFVSDESVEPDSPVLMPAAEFYQLWGGDKTPQFPDDGSMPQWRSYFPPVGGFRFGLFTIPPEIAAEDQAFFNAKGGKIGLWTAAAPNALLEDFGGGTVAP